MTDDAQEANKQAADAAGAPDVADAPDAQGAGTASRPRPQAHVIDAADERPHGVALARVALALGAACVLKLCLTQLCVEGDWVGGEFFPLIYCGVCLGYVLALVTGASPLVPVACASGALVGAATSRPILTTCVLALCFPPASLPVVALSAYVGGKTLSAIDAKHARTP